MPFYKKGEQTYGELIQCARRLFYQKGYKATYCQEITDSAGVNSGLFHYYFKSKANIALLVLSSVYAELQELSSAYFSKIPFLTRIALETELLWVLIRKNNHFCRFMSELASEHIPSKLELTSSFQYLENVNQHLKKNLSEDKIKLLAKLALASEYELILFYAKGDYEISGDEYMNQDIRIFLQLFSVSPEEIEKAICEADKILSKWKLDISEEMNICISPR